MSTTVIELYNLDVVNQKFTRLDIIDFSYKNLQYFNRLNGIGACQFDLAVQNPKATLVNLRRYANYVVVKRNGVVKWVGPITDVSGSYDNVVGDLTIQANTMLWNFKDRYSNQLDQYTSQDLSTTAWAQINQAQNRSNGTLLITQGTLQTSSSQPITLQYRSIYDMLTQFAGFAGGFDFDFTPTVTNGLLTGFVFNTYNPRLGSIRTDLPDIQLGVNLKSVNFKTNNPIYNSGIATGSGTGSTVLTSQVDMLASEQVYTRRETIQAYKDESVPSVLSLRLTTFLNNNSAENYILDLELYPQKHPFLDELNLGDVIQLNIQIPQGSYANFTNQAIITDLTVQVDQTGRERIIPKVILIN